MLRAIDEDAARERALTANAERGAVFAFVLCTLLLVFMEYAGSSQAYGGLLRLLDRLSPGLVYGPGGFASSRWYVFSDLAFWVGVRIVGFLVVPALCVRVVLRERLREHGLAMAGLKGHGRTYFVLFALMLPLIALAASRPEFVAYYPFYRLAHASWCDFLAWELLYAAHFFALEFFFRGFWLKASRAALGSHAIYAVMVPYCMIHFTKPVLEVLGAIVAGIVLGALAMRTRSIWGGVFVHVAVAWTMDVLALWRGKGLPTGLWP